MKYIEKGAWPDTKRFFSVMRCNHCSDAPCVEICPTTALFRREDGIVDFDTDRCIGCKSCMQACPYDALYIDSDENTTQKCNYCVHRVEVGLEPACVVVGPEQAIIAGDLDDPATRIAQIVAAGDLSQRAPEQGTSPNLWYKGVDESSIDPLGAVDPGDGGIWRDPAMSWLSIELTPPSVTAPIAPLIPKPEPGPRVVYDDISMPRIVYTADHPMPWGWRVSSYFLTKGISAGIAITLAIALLAGAGAGSAWARWGAPLIAGLFLAATGVLLIADLKRLDRFVYLMTKGNTRSWLVRGTYILSLYAAILALWVVFGAVRAEQAVTVLIWAAAVVALGVAAYTAFLFGQAEGRDLWQSPTLLWHMIAGAFSAGGGLGLLAAIVFEVPSVAETTFGWSLLGGSLSLGLIATVELSSDHPTRNITEAIHHMTKGAYATEWWFGGQLLGVVLPVLLAASMLASGWVWIGAVGGVASFAGIWFADDAFVKAEQSVPLS